jgi:phage-related protein
MHISPHHFVTSSPKTKLAFSAVTYIEIRLRGTEGIFRVVFVAKFPEAIYVLHCFQKKTKY